MRGRKLLLNRTVVDRQSSRWYGWIASFVAMCDGEIERLELVRTIPLSTPLDRFDKIRKEMQHLYAVPVYRADQKELGHRRLEPLCAECGQVERAGIGVPRPRDENSIPWTILRFVKLQAMCWHEILSSSAEHAKLFRGQFGLPFQVTTKLHTIRYVDAKDSDTG